MCIRDRPYTINKFDLLQGYSDPEGDFLSIGDVWTEFGSLDETGNLPISETDSILISTDQYENYVFTIPENIEGTIRFNYYIVDQDDGAVEVSQSFKINSVSYDTIESDGDISLVTDDLGFGYAQDSQGKKHAITYFGEHTSLDMWGGGWTFLAAENINGINSVIWKFTDNYNYGGYGGDSFWLGLFDENWSYFDSGDVGWQGDPYYGDSPDRQFYKTETNFNLDLNDDGNIGAPPNKDPLLTGIPFTLPNGRQNQQYTINKFDLLQGYSDPEGDFLSIEAVSYTHLTLPTKA